MRRKNTRPTIIYWLVDTRTNTPFYCGKSVRANVRLKEHKRVAALGGNRPVLARLRDCGENVRLQIMESIPADGDWIDREKKWISILRTQFANITNVADGGTGIPGYAPNEQQRKNIGAATRARSQCPIYRAKLSAAHKGQKLSPEHRAQAAVHLRALTQTQEHRERNSATSKKRWQNPEYRAQMIANSTGRKLSNEAREKVAASKRGKPLSAEHREKVGVAHRGKIISESQRAAVSAAHKGKPKSPEQRAKMSASARAWRAQRSTENADHV